MPVSKDQWRASVGSNNASRARVFSKIMNNWCSSESFLSQLLTFILALITSVRTGTDKGEIICSCVCAYNVSTCVHVCISMLGDMCTNNV